MRIHFLCSLVFFSMIANGQLPNKDKHFLPPDFISPLVPITVRVIPTPPSPSQATDFLLWYRGKKVNDSILITPDATLVLYSKPRDMVIVQPPAKKDPTQSIVKELANTQKRKDDFYSKIAERKSSVLLFPAISSALKEYDKISGKFSQFLKNTIQLPTPLSAIASGPKSFSSGYANIQRNYIVGVPEYVRKAFNDVLYAKKNYPSINFPPPSATDFGACGDCDTSISGKQDRAENEWNEEFFRYEADLIRRSVNIFQTLEKLSLNEDPEALKIRKELNSVMEFALARNKNKIEMLLRQYGNDFTRLPLIIRAVISAERQKQLLGVVSEESYAKTMMSLVSLFGGFDKYLEQQAAAHNYDVMFNLGFILGMERQRQLLSTAEDDNKTASYIDMFNAFNRFKITMELDYRSTEEGDCGTSTDKVIAKNDGDFFMSLFSMNCKYFWAKNEQHFEDGKIHQFGLGEWIPLITGQGTRVIKEKNDNDECVTRSLSYSNLPVKPVFPDVLISFCENESIDTLYFNLLHDGKKPKENKSQLYGYISEIFHFTGDDIPVDESLEDESDRINEVMENYTLKESTVKKKLSLQETDIYYNMLARRYAINSQKTKNDVEDQEFLRTFNAKNGDPIIMDLDTPLSFENDIYERKATIKVKIKVVHDPLPHKTNGAKK